MMKVTSASKHRSLEIIRGALGEKVAELVLANAVPEYSEIADNLNELGRKLKMIEKKSINEVDQ
jgi:hypothetical protein